MEFPKIQPECLTLSTLVEDLTSLSETTFHHALGRLSSAGDITGTDGVHLVVVVANRLISRGELGERVQADRVHTLLRRIELTENALSELALKSRALPPGVRNSVAGFLAPAQRRLLLGRLSDGEDLRQPLATPLIGIESTASYDAQKSDAPSSTPVLHSNPYSTVVLLAGPFQNANKNLLDARGFGPIVWTSLDDLEQDLEHNADVCACLVDGSALQVLDSNLQKRLFHLLGTYSTFLWIRVEDKNLKLSPDEIRECLRSARCMREEVPAALFSIQADATLREREVDDIAAASRTLKASADAEFIPGEITTDQAKVLMAAAKLHARELQLEGQVELRSLEARFLSGGRSSARIAVLRVNHGECPIIAKIDSKVQILDEMRRFRTFIEPWDNELRPKLHFHGEAAVLLFGLVPDQRDRSRPAEVLASRLEALWNDQLFGVKSETDLVRDREALAEGAENTAQRLGQLNSRRPPDTNLPPLGNPHIGVFENLDKSGINWGLPESARIALLKAKERFFRLEQAATIHGDVHLKNILLRDDRLPHLIDYAGSGPGHPSVDLVRFELALFLGPLRQIESEQQCIEYQRSLTFDGTSYSSLEQRFINLHRCHLNVVCLRGCVAARDQALSVLKPYGGEPADYHATKYLVAWQNLVMMERHTGLARATIFALAPEIARW